MNNLAQSLGLYGTLRYIYFRVSEHRRVIDTAMIATLAFRVEPKRKEVLRTASQQKHLFIANMVAVLIQDYRRRNDTEIEEQDKQIDL